MYLKVSGGVGGKVTIKYKVYHIILQTCNEGVSPPHHHHTLPFPNCVTSNHTTRVISLVRILQNWNRAHHSQFTQKNCLRSGDGDLLQEIRVMQQQQSKNLCISLWHYPFVMRIYK